MLWGVRGRCAVGVRVRCAVWGVRGRCAVGVKVRCAVGGEG